MFQLSKKVEYGLIAIRHMAAGGPGQIHTAKEIADRYHIPYELLAKVMQKLAKKGVLFLIREFTGAIFLPAIRRSSRWRQSLTPSRGNPT